MSIDKIDKSYQFLKLLFIGKDLVYHYEGEGVNDTFLHRINHPY